MKEYYSIGEFCKLFGLNVQTLHYYDAIGLFRPGKRDEKTGRRLYAFDQVYPLASILFMRRLGYPIEKIKETISVSDVGKALEGLKERSRQMKAQWKDLLFIDNAIARKIHLTEERIKSINVDEIAVRSLPRRYYLPIGPEENLYLHDSFYFYQTVVFYHGDEKIFGAYLGETITGTELNPRESGNLEIATIEAGRFICAYHKGPYSSVPDTYKRASEAFPTLHHDYEHINFNIIDQFVESDSGKFITEVQIPIREE